MRVVGKYCFALGDLSTSLEMTGHFYHHNKIRLSGFYFTFLWKISSTQWISPVKDGFHCEALLRLRGFLHAFHLVEMTIPKKTSSPAKSCHSEDLNNPKHVIQGAFNARRNSGDGFISWKGRPSL